MIIERITAKEARVAAEKNREKYYDDVYSMEINKIFERINEDVKTGQTQTHYSVQMVHGISYEAFDCCVKKITEEIEKYGYIVSAGPVTAMGFIVLNIEW